MKTQYWGCPNCCNIVQAQRSGMITYAQARLCPHCGETITRVDFKDTPEEAEQSARERHEAG